MIKAADKVRENAGDAEIDEAANDAARTNVMSEGGSSGER